MSKEIIFEALYSDGTGEYRIPAQPDKGENVKLRIRTAKDNVTEVFLIWGNERLALSKELSEGRFDFFAATVNAGEEITNYCFEIHSGAQVCFYNKKGVTAEHEAFYDFQIMPGFKTPDWAKGAVFYQIFTDRFYNGDKSNDVEDREYVYINKHSEKVTDWAKYPAADGIREFYGGDLQGVIDKLDYLEDLGIEAIYFNPLFVSPSNHKYDIQDYDHIDPHFGRIVKDEGECLAADDFDNCHATRYINRVTDRENLEASNELFIELVKKAHERGIKVILDGVFNHCGSFHKWMDHEKIYEKNGSYEPGAYVSENSPYNSYFGFKEGSAWPDNEDFDGWWGHKTLPKLKYEGSEALFEEIMRIARKWVSEPFNADGWRLDVAADLGHSPEYNHFFWKEFYRNVKESNPNAIIFAEHYGDPAAWLSGGEWDSVMNYDAFMEPVTWFLTGMQKHSDDYKEELRGNADVFFASMMHHMSRYNTQSLMVAMNELSNHDHSRFLTRTNRKVGRVATAGSEAASEGVRRHTFREGIVIQMTWPGAPTLYYGDEAGVCGWTDPDNRRTYPWGREDKTVLEFYKGMIKVHKDNPALRNGSYKELFSRKNIIGYGRFCEGNKVVVLVNSGDGFEKVRIPVWQIGVPDDVIMTRVAFTGKYNYTFRERPFEVKDGFLDVEMPEYSAWVLKY